ncbi:hypothetical protein R1sor_001480 [Riccia sorocarpa]|uniref:Pentatricopeptide repeat-containing protein-mitochondrial domain-containing protein n=1 Tax=Riccia sorocarpa TaxID=122646 RepID=A0ABD3GWE2_9MARC
MASLRPSSRCLLRHLKGDAFFRVQGLSRSLSSLSLSSLNSWGSAVKQERSSKCDGTDFDGTFCGGGSSNCGQSVLGIRKLNTSATESQTQLEHDVPTPAGYTAPPSPLRSYSPVLSGFSVLPTAGIPAGLSPPSEVGRFSLESLGREMSNRLSLGRLEETIQLFEDWVKVPDLDGKSKIPNLMVYNLLLHAKLRIGADPRNLLQIVKEMEMNGVKPNLLTYNFLLRAVFRHRNSFMAENILERMKKSGPEAQPDGDAYNFVIVLCALDRRLGTAMKHLQDMYDGGYVPSKTTYNELVLAATRSLRTRVAVSVLKEMKKHNVVPQLQNIVELAVAATEVDDSECSLLALRFLTETELRKSARNLTMDEGSVLAILSCAARTSDADLSKEAWNMLLNSLRDTKPPQPACYLARIHALSAAGDFDTAFSTLHEMQTAHSDSQKTDTEMLSPFSSLRPLVLACTRGGAAALDAAYYKLAEMHSQAKPVALAAINCVIQGCSNIWDYDRAYQTFESIGTTFSLIPDVHSCNALLDAFGKNRRTAEVLQIYKYMEEMQIKPDFRTYNLLIDAHVVNRDAQAALDAVDSMVKAGHSPSRETIRNIHRRCLKEGDEERRKEVDRLARKFGYRDFGVYINRWQEIGRLA